MDTSKAQYRTNPVMRLARRTPAASPEPVKQYRRRIHPSPGHTVRERTAAPSASCLSGRHENSIEGGDSDEEETCIAEFLANREHSRTQPQERHVLALAQTTPSAHTCQSVPSSTQHRQDQMAGHASGVPQPSSTQQLPDRITELHGNTPADCGSCGLRKPATSGCSSCTTRRLCCTCDTGDSQRAASVHESQELKQNHVSLQAELQMPRCISTDSCSSTSSVNKPTVRQAPCSCSRRPHTDKPVLTYTAVMLRRKRAACMKQQSEQELQQHSQSPTREQTLTTVVMTVPDDKHCRKQPEQIHRLGHESSAKTLRTGTSSNRTQLRRPPPGYAAGVHTHTGCRNKCQCSLQPATYSSLHSLLTSKTGKPQTALLRTSSTAAHSAHPSAATAIPDCSIPGQQRSSHLSAVQSALPKGLQYATAANPKAADVSLSTANTATLSEAQPQIGDEPELVNDIVTESMVTSWYQSPEDCSTSCAEASEQLSIPNGAAKASSSGSSTWSKGSRCISGVGYSPLQRKVTSTWQSTLPQQQQQQQECQIKAGQLIATTYLPGRLHSSHSGKVVTSAPGVVLGTPSVPIAVFAGVDAVVPELIQASSSILDQLQQGLGGLRLSAARMSSADNEALSMPLRRKYQ